MLGTAAPHCYGAVGTPRTAPIRTAPHHPPPNRTAAQRRRPTRPTEPHRTAPHRTIPRLPSRMSPEYFLRSLLLIILATFSANASNWL